jgi:hypothetical protein
MEDMARQKVIDAIEQALISVGAKGFEDAEATMQQIADFFSYRVKPLMNRERLNELLEKAEISSTDEQMLMAISESLPSLIAVGLTMLSSHATKSFPLPNTGRPKSLTSQKRRAVCENIAKLHAEGTNLITAKQRTAQKFNVSLSTVERIWAERKKGHKPSVNEVIDFFKSKNSNTAPKN